MPSHIEETKFVIDPAEDRAPDPRGDLGSLGENSAHFQGRVHKIHS